MKPGQVSDAVAAKLEDWLAVPGLPKSWCEKMDVWIVGGMFYGFKLKGLNVVLNYYAARELSELMHDSALRNGSRGYTGCDIAGLLHNITWENRAAAVYWLDRPYDVRLLAYAVFCGYTTQEARDAVTAVLSAERDQVLAEWARFEGQHVILIRTEGVYNSGQNCWVRTALFPFSFWFQRDRGYIDCDEKSLKHVTDLWSHAVESEETALSDSGFGVCTEN
jgi:hypothetical protein